MEPEWRNPDRTVRERRKILLVGCSRDVMDSFHQELRREVWIGTLDESDSLTREHLLGADAIVVDFSRGSAMAERLAPYLGDNTSPSIIFSVGNTNPSAELRTYLPSILRLSEPVDFSYVRGVLDSVRLERRRLQQIDEEQQRIHSLYDLSSSLLKVTSRQHISGALQGALPKLLDASLLMLCFPNSLPPLVYLDERESSGSKALAALRVHLSNSWRELRPDSPVVWDWLEALPMDGRSIAEDWVQPDSFTSTPITRGNVTEGFLTMLPHRGDAGDELLLQTFFVVGDLLSVLLYNIDLKERLEERATHDGLTQLLNRQTLFEMLDRECRRSQRYEVPLSLVMMDLDHFKLVNDRFGHQAGDTALRIAAQAIIETSREADVAGRCGGEEFIVILPETDGEGAEIWAERLRRLLEVSPIVDQDKTFHITASLGVATVVGAAATVEYLVAQADAALYESKNRGRNKVTRAEIGPNDWRMEGI